MRRAIIPALLLVLVSVVLGATVFREQVANAAATLLVREQNLDANGNIKVHEQGTAKVSPALPNTAFSLAGSLGDFIGPDPGGTRYAVTSITVANWDGGQTLALRLTARRGDLTCGSAALVENGPVVVAAPNQTVHVDFPQPFVFEGGTTGSVSCLFLGQMGPPAPAYGCELPPVGCNVVITVDGYRL